MTRRTRRTFTKEFKEQIAQLHLSGKPRAEIIKEYELTPSSFDRWINQHKQMVRLKKKIIELQNRENSSDSVKKTKDLPWKMIF